MGVTGVNRIYALLILVSLVLPSGLAANKRCWQKVKITNIESQNVGGEPADPVGKLFAPKVLNYTAVSDKLAFVFKLFEYRFNKEPALRIDGPLRFAIEQNHVFLLDEHNNEFELSHMTIEPR